MPVLSWGADEQRVLRQVVCETTAARQVPTPPGSARRAERNIVVDDVRHSCMDRALRIIQVVAVTVCDVVGYNVIVAPNHNSVACVIDESILLYGHVRRYGFAATRIEANSGPVVLDDVVGDKTAIRASRRS